MNLQQNSTHPVETPRSLTHKRSVSVVAACLALATAWPPATRADEAVAFRERCATRAAAGDSLAVPGVDGWLFLRPELRHLGVGPWWGAAAAKVSRAKPDKADPRPVILDFHEQLAKRGISLLLVPVPCKAAIYPERLGAAAGGRVDAAAIDFYAVLAAEGVAVVDLADGFLAAKVDDASVGPVYCRTDTHWSPRGCEVAAAAVAERIKKIPGSAGWLADGLGGFTVATEQRLIAGDLAAGSESEVLPARVVTGAGGGTTEDRASPVLLLGDSHLLVYHAGGDLHGRQAGLADQVAFELGMPVDVIGVRGSGATPARINLLRRAKPDPAYLAGKKVVVWCFAAREFTESSGWAVVPLPAAGP